MIIDYAHLGRLDLNLLVALDALLSERSVTRAAERIGVGQSAMSHSLARLRDLFGDPLLVRAQGGMRPTPRALQLADQVHAALAALQAAIRPERAFDAATADRTFRIGLSDHQELALMPALLAYCQKNAPGIRLRVRSTDRFDVLDELDANRLDLAVGTWTDGGFHHKRRLLFSVTFSCIFEKALVGAQAPISLSDYLAHGHVLASPREDAHGVVDEALAKLGLERRIALATPHFLAIPFALKTTPLIATLPTQLAQYFARALMLEISPPPVALPSFDISLLWHASFDDDPAHRWLRRTIARLAGDISIQMAG